MAMPGEDTTPNEGTIAAELVRIGARGGLHCVHLKDLPLLAALSGVRRAAKGSEPADILTALHVYLQGVIAATRLDAGDRDVAIALLGTESGLPLNQRYEDRHMSKNHYYDRRDQVIAVLARHIADEERSAHDLNARRRQERWAHRTQLREKQRQERLAGAFHIQLKQALRRELREFLVTLQPAMQERIGQRWSLQHYVLQMDLMLDMADHASVEESWIEPLTVAMAAADPFSSADLAELRELLFAGPLDSSQGDLRTHFGEHLDGTERGRTLFEQWAAWIAELLKQPGFGRFGSVVELVIQHLRRLEAEDEDALRRVLGEDLYEVVTLYRGQKAYD